MENTCWSKNLPTTSTLCLTSLASIVGTWSSLRSSLWPSLRSSLRPCPPTSIAWSLWPLCVTAVARPLRSWSRTGSASRFFASSKQAGDSSKDALQQVELPVDDVPDGSLLPVVQLPSLHPVRRIHVGQAGHQGDQQHQVHPHLD